MAVFVKLAERVKSCVLTTVSFRHTTRNPEYFVATQRKSSSLLCVGNICYDVHTRPEDRATLESDPIAVAWPMDGQDKTLQMAR